MVKKFLLTVVFALAVFGVVGTAYAVDFGTTWSITDVVNPSPYIYINTNGANDPYNYQHNLLVRGFIPGVYTVTSSDLDIDLDDDQGGDGAETVTISYESGSLVGHNASTNANNLSPAASAFADGILNVQLNATQGDFRFDDSTLTVSGTRTIVPVDLELALLVDISSSISTTEFNIQKQGYVNAFQSATIKNLITDTSNGRLGKIAATLVYWAENNDQTQAVRWTLIDSAAASDAFAAAINATTRPGSGNTSISDALDFIDNQMVNNGFDGSKLVIDISSDGENNSPNSNVNTMTNARNAALAQMALSGNPYAINGLVFVSDFPNLDTYFTNNVIGGTDAFVLTVDDINDFGSALETKLAREIGGNGNGNGGYIIPEPGSVALLGLGLLGLARRLRKRSA